MGERMRVGKEESEVGDFIASVLAAAFDNS